MIRKMRSTSATSFSSSYKRPLDDLLARLHTAPAVGTHTLHRRVDLQRQSRSFPKLLNSARLPGVSSFCGVSSACPASTRFASSAIRFRYSSYSIALAFRA